VKVASSLRVSHPPGSPAVICPTISSEVMEFGSHPPA
jgi:hypothetical protein